MTLPAKGWNVHPELGLVSHSQRNPWLGRNGYFYIDAGQLIEKRKLLVHRVVWESENGPIPDGLCINHINGTKTDNRISNLELVSLRENNTHARLTGLTAKGERSGNASLTEEQVREIAASEGTQREVADRYGVTRGAIKEIWAGRTWRHLGLPIRSPRRVGKWRGYALNESIVLSARRRAKQGESVPVIARDLGVNASTLAKAVSGYSWAHLPGALK